MFGELVDASISINSVQNLELMNLLAIELFTIRDSKYVKTLSFSVTVPGEVIAPKRVSIKVSSSLFGFSSMIFVRTSIDTVSNFKLSLL